MENKIICIGRQFGSGGHQVAVRVGEQLGIAVYDKDILRLACRYGGLDVHTLEKEDEKATNPLLYRTVHEGNQHVSGGLPASEVLFRLESHEIRRIAARESCIFVGRCADYVLREKPVKLLRVFITAPAEQRAQRKAEQEQIPLGKARRLVAKVDKQRRKYYESYTGQLWGDAHFYDLCLDTGAVGIDGAVEAVAARYREL